MDDVQRLTRNENALRGPMKQNRQVAGTVRGKRHDFRARVGAVNKGVAAILAAILTSGCAHFKPSPPVKGCNFGLLSKMPATQCLPYGQVEKTVFSLDKLVPKNMLFDEDGIGISVYRLDAARYVQFEYVDEYFHDYREPRCLLSIFIYDFDSGHDYAWNQRDRVWIKSTLSASRDQLDEMMGDMQRHD